MQDSWQCHVCGTVYAWWVASCRQKHKPGEITERSRRAAQKTKDVLDRLLDP